MKYYEVVAKCGHVGRDKYFEAHFFVKAESTSEACERVRQKPRVKHHRKDAIMDAHEVTQEEFWAGNERQWNNPYFRCRKKSDLLEILPLIKDFIHLEYVPSHKRSERKPPVPYNRVEVKRETTKEAEEYCLDL